MIFLKICHVMKKKDLCEEVESFILFTPFIS